MAKKAVDTPSVFCVRHDSCGARACEALKPGPGRAKHEEGTMQPESHISCLSCVSGESGPINLSSRFPVQCQSPDDNWAGSARRRYSAVRARHPELRGRYPADLDPLSIMIVVTCFAMR